MAREHTPMTARELIDALSKIDPDTPVWITGGSERDGTAFDVQPVNVDDGVIFTNWEIDA